VPAQVDLFNYKSKKNEFIKKIANRPELGLYNDDEQLLEGRHYRILSLKRKV
jgi:hypothetical protein